MSSKYVSFTASRRRNAHVSRLPRELDAFGDVLRNGDEIFLTRDAREPASFGPPFHQPRTLLVQAASTSVDVHDDVDYVLPFEVSKNCWRFFISTSSCGKEIMFCGTP